MSLSSYTKEFKYNFKIAYPIILGMLGHTLVGFVDNVMVGKVGITELGAAALGNTAIFIAMSFAIGFSVASTSLVAMADEAGDKPTAQSILNHGMVLNVILGVVLFLLLFFVEPVMRYTGQSEKVIELAVPYPFGSFFAYSVGCFHYLQAVCRWLINDQICYVCYYLSKLAKRFSKLSFYLW